MAFNFIQWRSLKTRVIFFTLSIFLISIWTLVIYTSQLLREDIQRLLGEQQFSMVSFIAEEVNQEIKQQFNELEIIAERVTPAMLNDQKTLLTFLENRLINREHFNAGIIAFNADDTAVADSLITTEPREFNYEKLAHTAALIKQNKALISQPYLSKNSKSPEFGMAVPIRDVDGKMIGTLVGVTRLVKHNFLVNVTQSSYGKTGYYLIEDQKSKMIITGTDKSRIMQALPATGINPLIGSHLQGNEGTGVTINPLGIEVFASAKRIPIADWLIIAALPTDELFAPIRAIQRNILLAAIILTLLSSVLTWWILRRQLAQMLYAAKTLSGLSDINQFPQTLSINRQDEIGELIGGFNNLLQTLKQRDLALKESESRFRVMADSAPVLIWVAGVNKLCQYFNKVWLEFTGRSIEQEMGNGWAEGVHSEDYQRCLVTYMTAFDAQQEFVMEYRLRRFDGEYRWLTDKGVPRYDNQGTFMGYIGSCVDITERKHAEFALQESEFRWKFAIEGSGDGLWDWNVPDGTVFFSKIWKQMLGYSDDEIGNQLEEWEKRIHPEDITDTLATVQDYLHGKTPIYLSEHRVRCKDNSYKWILARGMVVSRDEDGKPLSLIGTHTDITKRKEAEAAQEEALSILQKIASRVPGVVYQYRLRADGSSCFPYASEAIREIYRISPEEIRQNASQIFDLIYPEDLKGVVASILKSAQNLTPWSHDYRVKFADGTTRWLLGNALPQREEDGSVLWHGFITDITEHKRAESEQRIASIAFECQEGILVMDENLKILRINNAFTRITGYTQEQSQGHTPTFLGSNRHPNSFYETLKNKVTHTGHWLGEMWQRRSNGEEYPAQVSITAVKDETGKITHFVGNIVDATNIHLHEQQRLLNETAQRNLLVREVHHRIKNNLQGITGILRQFSQAHPEMSMPINQAISQVQSISVIYGLQGQAVKSSVRLCELTISIAAGLEALWQKPITVKITDDWAPCIIAETEAVPLALVLNELISNALKHGGPNGQVRIMLCPLQHDNSIRLLIQNLGQIPTGFGLKVPNSFGTGLQLVVSLLPQTGAKLHWAQHENSVITTLDLAPPIIQLESITLNTYER
jgi:PAS domain S-box-containing protein